MVSDTNGIPKIDRFSVKEQEMEEKTKLEEQLALKRGQQEALHNQQESDQILKHREQIHLIDKQIVSFLCTYIVES